MSLTTEGKPRIESLDVLRGFAILGILIVNAPYFASVWQAAMIPDSVPHLAIDESTLWSWLVMHTFFEFKCITLFSMLFGVSIYLVGGERSDKEKGKQLRRRLSWMVLFGLIHGALIWYGDILLVYALTGFLVLLARSWRPMTLMIVGVILTLSLSGLLGLMMLGGDHMPPEIAAKQAAAFAVTPEEFAALKARITGGFISTVSTNFEWWVSFAGQSLFVVPRTAGVMMIGLALFKWGFLAARSPVWVYVVFLVLGAASFAVTWMEGLREFESGFDRHQVQGEGMLVLSLASPFGTLFYVSLLILLLKSGIVGFLLNILAATGRMAFTNYISQSLIMTTIFWHLGHFGEISRPDLWLVVGGVWLAELIWSPLWLSMFAMGPLEWLWRCLTYKRWVPITKSKTAARPHNNTVEETMKKFAAILALGVALSGGAAFADTIQNGYGNTFVVTSANGSVARYYLNEDGTFTGVAPGGSTMAGTYTAADGQVCLNPPNGGAPQCTAIAADKNVGDTWTQTGADGAEITVTLEAGR